MDEREIIFGGDVSCVIKAYLTHKKIKLINAINKTVSRPAIFYDARCWALE